MTLLVAALTMGLGGSVLAAPEPMTPDSKSLDEMAQDLLRFSEAVKGYRSAATNIIRRAYVDRIRGIRGKYEPLITMNEREERERRLDAIAMFEAFLRKYPSDRRWTPDAMFRLAELYYEKASDEFLTAQEAYQRALDSPTPPTTASPKPDYSNTIDLYRRLLTEFPSYRLLDAAYYLLGFCLGEMGQEPEAKQAMLALTCSNRYKPLDPPPPADPSALSASTRGPLADSYEGCVPIKKESKFVPEAWTRVGEMHFDGGELPLAISAYRRVLDYKDSAYYDKALYKLAWSYYRDNRFPEAIKEFDNLVRFADERKAAGDKFGSDLRPEAIQYLGISFSEPDWDGDTVADLESGLSRIDKFYQGRNDAHIKEVYQKLGDIYFDQTKYSESIAVYKALLGRWPFYADAPKIQDKVVRAHERDRNMVMAAREREALGRTYAKGSDWWNANRNDPDALAAAQRLAEDALLMAATNVHAQAQVCRQQYVQSKDAAKLRECELLYQTSAELYEKYLAAYPNSKKAYEFSLYWADALYFGGNLPKAVVAYTTLRDSNLDNKHQSEAAYQIIKVYEELIEKMKASRQIDEPPIPDEKNTQPPVNPIAVPDVYRKYVEALDWYVNNIRDNRVPEMQYAAAVVLLRYRQWPEARGRLTNVTGAYCSTKPEIGFQAYDALLTTYFIDFNVQDEELKDCALGRLLTVAEQFAESACSRSVKAADFAARITAIKNSVKSTVITRRVQLAIENEEKGTDRQLVQCRDGQGGIALVTGAAAPRPGTPGAGPATGGPAPAGRLGTEMDEGLALDLIDLVNGNPKDQDAPINLNNACVVYERLYKFGEATRCYERLARDYPDAGQAKDALWNAARNHRRFFNFDRAVQIYQQIATDPKFADYENRKEAMGHAAMMLDNDQQYPRAADFYKRFSGMNNDKPQDAAQSYGFACTAYEKMKDTAKERQCLNELISRFGGQPAAGEDVVKAHMKLAVLAEKSGNQKATIDAYRKVRDEFVRRQLAPATPAAEAAAKAEFLLIEQPYNTFVAKTFPSDPKQLKKAFDRFTEEARALSDQYKRVWDYKNATWTLASLLRMGDIYFQFAQKLVKVAETPPADIKALAKKADRLNPGDGEVVLGQYKDAVYQYVTPLEEEAKKQWRATLERASGFGVTNEYVKKARENLSKYLPDEFPFIKDERISWELP